MTGPGWGGAVTRGWLLAAVGGALLGALLASTLGTDPYANPDSRAFVSLAHNVAAGRGLIYQDQGAPDFTLKAFRPPLYPLLLGGLLVLRLPLGAALPLQGALYGLVGVLAAWTAARAAGPRAGWIAGALAWAWWPMWLMSGQFLTETLYTALLAAAMAATAAAVPARGSRGALIAGLLAGAAILARATGVAAAAACALALALRAPRRLAPFLLGVLLLWAPWMVRNSRVLGSWVGLQTSGGMNVWSGSTGRPIGEAWTLFQQDLPRLGEVGSDRAFYHRTAVWTREHPVGWAVNAARRAADYLLPIDRSAEFLAYRLALPCVLLGAWVAWRDPRWTLPLLAWALHAGLGALTVGSPRYRLPAELPGALLAAAAVDWMAARFGGRRAAWACAGLLALGLAAVAAQAGLTGGS